MEFIKGLEKALELGLTKEEFMSLWETELKSGNVHAMSVNSSQASQNHIIGDEGCRTDQSSHEWQQVRDELKQELNLQLKVLLSQQMEKLEQYWQQIQKKTSQLMEEVHHQFGILCQHVSNTAECQGNSLKLNIMQEFDLLKEDLKKGIEKQCTKYADEPAMFRISSGKSKVTCLRNDQDEQNIHEFGDPMVDMVDDVKMSKQESTTELYQCEENQQDKEEGDDSHGDLDYDWHMEEALLLVDISEKTSQNRGKSLQETTCVPSKSHKKGFKGWKQTCSHPLKHVNDEYEDSSLSSAISQSTVSEVDEFIKATGFYAEAISNQMRQSSPCDSSLSTSNKSSIYSSKVVSPSKADNYFHWNTFTITDSKEFSASREIHSSPFIDAKMWKARLSVTFNDKQQLKVRVRVSRGDHNSNTTWPLKFMGFGYIFHPTSKRFTQIWELPVVTCQKPSLTGEVGFPAEICLSTNRGSYPDVSYQELELRNYTENNKILLKWNLKAAKLPAIKSKASILNCSETALA